MVDNDAAARNGNAHVAAKGLVLVFEDDAATQGIIASVLGRNEIDVIVATTGPEALRLAVERPPDLIIINPVIADEHSTRFCAILRGNVTAHDIPILFLTASAGRIDVVRDFDVENDGYIRKPVRPPELIARVRAILARTPAASRMQRGNRAPLNEGAFEIEARNALARAERQRLSGTLAYVELFELTGIREAVGAPGEALIGREFVLLTERFSCISTVGVDTAGRYLVFVETTSTEARFILNDLSRAIVAHRFHVGAEPIRLTPIVGFSSRDGGMSLLELRRRASIALASAESNLDLQAVRYSLRLERAAAAAKTQSQRERLMSALKPLVVPFQIASTLLAGLMLPFLFYWFAAAHGVDITGEMYVICVAMLLITTIGIWAENFLALKDENPPSAVVYPDASAIIAAYLPNEAATVIETIESFLRLNYDGKLQIILAYNTPRSLPMEEELRAIAERDPRFVPLRVMGSTSKAQNVNAALRHVRGAFVGVFDADHKPDAGSFTRAWDWLANGFDIVQGHCLIRNGDASLVARLVAIEFESIYAVSHPGRARMHGFGLFGGSNGYWKTDLLRQTRMHSFMLTEDIDSSLRVIEAGYRIASDPKLISRELAPLTFRAFWHQRTRWAQGWFQASIKHLVPAMLSPHIGLRQKVGMVHLLLWRELYIWVCLQILPILAYWTFVRHESTSWFIPIFLATTVVTMSTGPVQLLFTYLLAEPEIRRRKKWFLSYLFASTCYFTELKNVIARVAQLKEALQERAWKITPRSNTYAPTAKPTVRA